MHDPMLLIDENFKYLGRDKKKWLAKIGRQIGKYYTCNGFCDSATIGGEFSNMLFCKNNAGYTYHLECKHSLYKPTGKDAVIVKILKKNLSGKALTPKEAKIFKPIATKYKKENKIFTYNLHLSDGQKPKPCDSDFVLKMWKLWDYAKGKKIENTAEPLIFKDIWKPEGKKCDACEIKDLTSPLKKSDFMRIEFCDTTSEILLGRTKKYNQYIDKINAKKVKGAIIVLDVKW